MSPKLGLPSPFYTPWIRHLGTCTCGRLTNQFHGYHSSCRRGRGSSVEQALEYMNHTFYEFPFWGFSNFHPGFLSMRFNGCINQQPLQPWLEDQRSVFEEPDLFEFEVNLEIICWCCNISFQSHVSNIHIWGLFGDGGGV